MSTDFKIVLSNGKAVSPDQYVDSRRWLLNNNMITDSIKNDLFVLATIVNTKILAISLDVDFNKKSIDYVIYTDWLTMLRCSLAKKLKPKSFVYNLLSRYTGLLEDIYGHQDVINNNVVFALGPSWKASLRFMHISSYGKIESNEKAEKISFIE